VLFAIGGSVPVLNRVVAFAVVGNVGIAQRVCARQSYSKLLYCTGEERREAHKLGLQKLFGTMIPELGSTRDNYR
jgi:hypothetical protein